VHGPVVATLGVLPGSVERVDDPHARGLQPDRIVQGLFGQDGVPGSLGGEACGQQLLRGTVAERLELARRPVGGIAPDRKKRDAGLLGELASKRGIVHHYASGPVCVVRQSRRRRHAA
jgi:hypothetical protein